MKKKIKDYDNYYIYDTGDVYNQSTQKMLEGSIGEGGYKYYRLSKNGVKKMFYAHRLVAEAFIDNPNNLPLVNHLDGNKLNNDISNLEWASYSENMVHAYQNKLVNKIEKPRQYYSSDLPNEEWRMIKNHSNYRISNYARVHNLVTNSILRPSLTGGYLKVRLSEKGKTQDYFLHNLVYMTFNDLDNLQPGYLVDHIDAVKTNNNLSNLRLSSLSENVNVALYEQQTNKSCKAIRQFDSHHNWIADYPSARQAARELNLDSSTIIKCCKGKIKLHGGFIFEYLK